MNLREIPYIVCNFPQSPDRVCSLHGVVGYNHRGLAASEQDLHGGVTCILYTGALNQACNYCVKISHDLRNEERNKLRLCLLTSRPTHHWCNLI